MLINSSQNKIDFLSFFHSNIRSLVRNFDCLTNLLDSLNQKFSIIGISETWLNNLEHNVDIDGYNFVHNYRSDRPGGGVGLYLASELEYKSRIDLSFNDMECTESLFIEICKAIGKNFVVGVICIPPNQNVNNFVKNVNKLMAKISLENKLCYIMDDFNLNLMNYHSHQLTSEFLDIVYSNMFFLLITRPTRITSNTATLIDNIFTNNFDHFFCSGLLFTDISDHLPIFCIFYEHRADEDKRAYLIFREKTK